MKIAGKACVFLVLGFFLRAGVVFGYAGASSEALDSYLVQIENVSFEKEPLPHYRGLDNKGSLLYIFQSHKLGVSEVGFAGPIDLIIAVDSNKVIQGLIIERSQETPRYLRKIEPWLSEFREKPLSSFIGRDRPVDTVTHVTHSSQAVIDTTSKSAYLILNNFFAQKTEENLLKEIGGLKEAIIFFLFSLSAIFLFHKKRSKRVRYFFLLFLVLLVGFGFNLQFSSVQIASLFNLDFPQVSQLSLLVLIFIPLILGLFYGRIYCGWLCPFGALQELVADLSRPINVPKKFEKKLSYIKYVLLVGLICLLFFDQAIFIFNQDPLGRAFFLSEFLALDNFLVWVILFFSLFILRFWCRYFCIVGAFFSLFNRIALFRFIFKKKFSNCPWHVDKIRDLNCLLCNRCQNS